MHVCLPSDRRRYAAVLQISAMGHEPRSDGVAHTIRYCCLAAGQRKRRARSRDAAPAGIKAVNALTFQVDPSVGG